MEKERRTSMPVANAAAISAACIPLNASDAYHLIGQLAIPAASLSIAETCEPSPTVKRHNSRASRKRWKKRVCELSHNRISIFDRKVVPDAREDLAGEKALVSISLSCCTVNDIRRLRPEEIKRRGVPHAPKKREDGLFEVFTGEGGGTAVVFAAENEEVMRKWIGTARASVLHYYKIKRRSINSLSALVVPAPDVSTKQATSVSLSASVPRAEIATLQRQLREVEGNLRRLKDDTRVSEHRNGQQSSNHAVDMLEELLDETKRSIQENIRLLTPRERQQYQEGTTAKDVPLNSEAEICVSLHENVSSYAEMNETSTQITSQENVAGVCDDISASPLPSDGLEESKEFDLEYTKAMSRLTEGADTGSLSAEAYQMMQRERDDALRQVKELKDTLRARSLEESKLKKRIASDKSIYDRTIEEAEEKIALFENRFQHSQQENSALIEQLATAHAEIEGLRVTKSTGGCDETSNVEYEGRIQSLKCRVQNLEEEMGLLMERLDRKDSTIRSLERVLELEAKKQRMQRDKALQEAQEESIVPAERRVPLLKEKVEKLQLELDKMTELHQIESTARQELVCQVQESTQQLSMLWQQKNSLEEQLLCNETNFETADVLSRVVSQLIQRHTHDDDLLQAFAKETPKLRNAVQLQLKSDSPLMSRLTMAQEEDLRNRYFHCLATQFKLQRSKDGQQIRHDVATLWETLKWSNFTKWTKLMQEYDWESGGVGTPPTHA